MKTRRLGGGSRLIAKHRPPADFRSAPRRAAAPCSSSVRRPPRLPRMVFG